MQLPLHSEKSLISTKHARQQSCALLCTCLIEAIKLLSYLNMCEANAGDAGWGNEQIEPHFLLTGS